MKKHSKNHISIGIDDFGYFIKYKKSFYKLREEDQEKLLIYFKKEYSNINIHKCRSFKIMNTEK